MREDGNGLSLALPDDLRELSLLTVSDPSVVAVSVVDGWLELTPRSVGTAQVAITPSSGENPAIAEVVIRAAVGTFGIDIVMDHPALLGYEEALMTGADWWSKVLDGTEWPSRKAACPSAFGGEVRAIADDLLIRAWVDDDTSAAGYAVTCFRSPSTQVALDPGGGAVVADVASANLILVRHEIGHILGLVLWGPETGLVTEGEEYLYFVGQRAVEAFRASGGDAKLPGVPFDGVHWARGLVNDFMTPNANDGKISAAALADAGYTVAVTDPAPPSWERRASARTIAGDGRDVLLGEPCVFIEWRPQDPPR